MFNFNQILGEKSSDLKVFVNSEPFYPSISYKKNIQELLLENKNGRIIIENCSITNLKPTEIVDIQRYSIKFNDKFLNLNNIKTYFVKIEIFVEFFNFSKEELDLEDIDNHLTSIGATRYYDYDNLNTLTFKMKNIQNVDFKDLVKFHKERLSDTKEFNKKKKIISEDGKFNEEDLQRLNQINLNTGRKKFKDENGNEKSFEDNLPYNQGNSFNFTNRDEIKKYSEFPLLEKEQFQQNQNLNYSKLENIFDFSDENFIPFEEEKKFNFSYTEKNINPYKLDKKEDIKKFSKGLNVYNFRPCFNQRGEFITIGKFDKITQSFSFNVNKIIPNKNFISDKNIKKKNIPEGFHNLNSQVEIKEENDNENALLDDYFNLTIGNFNDIIKKRLNTTYSQKNIEMELDNDQVNLSDKNQHIKKIIEKRIDNCFDVADYTKIIWEYLSRLYIARSRFISMYKLSEKTELIKNLDKEISTLKLFTNLFLNCSLDLNNLNNFTNYKNASSISNNIFKYNFSKSLLMETQRLRKKKLLDWLINDNLNSKFIQEQIFETEKKKQNLEKYDYQENLYYSIFCCLINGRIQQALEKCNKNKLFNLSGLISQIGINSNIKNKEFFMQQIVNNTSNSQSKLLNYIYEILSANESKLSSDLIIQPHQRTMNNVNSNNFSFKNNLDNENINNIVDSQNRNLFFNEEILKKLNWKQLLITNSLYCLKNTSNIDDLMENYLSYRGNLLNSYPNIDHIIKENNYEDLNVLLLIYFHNIQKNKNDEEILTKIFTIRNIFSKFSDCHLHFILVTILLNSLIETYSEGEIRKNININQLKKIQFKLLIKLTEDLLINGDTRTAINIILISNLKNQNKINLIDEIIYSNISTDSKIREFYEIDLKTTHDALGIRSYSKFQIEKAVEYLKLSENYEKLHEVNLIFYNNFQDFYTLCCC